MNGGIGRAEGSTSDGWRPIADRSVDSRVIVKSEPQVILAAGAGCKGAQSGAILARRMYACGVPIQWPRPISYPASIGASNHDRPPAGWHEPNHGPWPRCGQSVFHLHVHLVQCHHGDGVVDPASATRTRAPRPCASTFAPTRERGSPEPRILSVVWHEGCGPRR
jgi:hypothetical protein